MKKIEKPFLNQLALGMGLSPVFSGCGAASIALPDFALDNAIYTFNSKPFANLEKSVVNKSGDDITSIVRSAGTSAPISYSAGEYLKEASTFGIDWWRCDYSSYSTYTSTNYSGSISYPSGGIRQVLAMLSTISSSIERISCSTTESGAGGLFVRSTSHTWPWYNRPSDGSWTRDGNLPVNYFVPVLMTYHWAGPGTPLKIYQNTTLGTYGTNPNYTDWRNWRDNYFSRASLEPFKGGIAYDALYAGLFTDGQCVELIEAVLANFGLSEDAGDYGSWSSRVVNSISGTSGQGIALDPDQALLADSARTWWGSSVALHRHVGSVETDSVTCRQSGQIHTGDCDFWVDPELGRVVGVACEDLVGSATNASINIFDADDLSGGLVKAYRVETHTDEVSSCVFLPHSEVPTFLSTASDYDAYAGNGLLLISNYSSSELIAINIDTTATVTIDPASLVYKWTSTEGMISSADGISWDGSYLYVSRHPHMYRSLLAETLVWRVAARDLSDASHSQGMDAGDSAVVPGQTWSVQAGTSGGNNKIVLRDAELAEWGI